VQADTIALTIANNGDKPMLANIGFWHVNGSVFASAQLCLSPQSGTEK